MTFDSVLSVLMLLFDTVDISKFSETLNCLCLFDVFWRAFNLSGPPATKHRYMGPETPLQGEFLDTVAKTRNPSLPLHGSFWDPSLPLHWPLVRRAAEPDRSAKITKCKNVHF